MQITKPSVFSFEKYFYFHSGNNYYGEELVSVLQAIKDPAERSQFILMDRILPPVYKNYIVHIDSEKPRLLDVVNEIGIFGVLLR